MYRKNYMFINMTSAIPSLNFLPLYRDDKTCSLELLGLVLQDGQIDFPFHLQRSLGVVVEVIWQFSKWVVLICCCCFLAGQFCHFYIGKNETFYKNCVHGIYCYVCSLTLCYIGEPVKMPRGYTKAMTAVGAIRSMKCEIAVYGCLLVSYISSPMFQSD